MILVTVLFINGCSSESLAEDIADWMENPDGNVAAILTEPLGNSQDFLLQDYNVKRVEEERIPALGEFDVTGPSYTGITEIVSDPGAIAAGDVSNSVTICLSTYHTQSNTNGSASKQSWACKSPNFTGEVWSTVKDLSYTKEVPFSGESELNSFLSVAYSRCKNGALSGGVITNGMIKEFNEVIGKSASEGLRGAGKIVSGYSYQRDGYSIENSITNKISSQLEEVGYRTVIPNSGNRDATDVLERAETATNAGAKLHVVIWSRANTFEECPGWFTVYRDIGEVVADSKKAAETVADSLSVCSIAGGRLKLGINNQKSVATGTNLGNSEYYTILNWSNVPTIILVVGSYKDKETFGLLKNNSIQTEISEAVADAVAKLYPLTDR